MYERFQETCMSSGDTDTSSVLGKLLVGTFFIIYHSNLSEMISSNPLIVAYIYHFGKTKLMSQP